MVRIAWSVVLIVAWLCPISTAAPAASSQPAASLPAVGATGGLPAVGATGGLPASAMLPPAVPTPHPVKRGTGYRGLWWMQSMPANSPVEPLSGGLALEPMDHAPVAQYAAAVDRTFFVYVGTDGGPLDDNGRQPAQIMVSYYDHKTGTVPAPVVLLDKLPAGAHGCPALSMDADGRVWVFVSILDADYPSTIFRSAKPYEIDAWEKVAEMDFRQPQVWYVPGQGFMLLHSRKTDKQPGLDFAISPDGLSWSKPVTLAALGDGLDFASGRHKNKIGVMFNVRSTTTPAGDMRTDVYYVETADFGKTWQAYPRGKVELPISAAKNPTLVYGQKNWRFIPRSLAFETTSGSPVMLYLAGHVRKPFASPESRIWTTSRWIGREWETNGVILSDSDYDAGSLYVTDKIWTATIPTRPGPQPLGAGGELVRYRSEDQGRSWHPTLLTPNCKLNANWARRPVDGKPDLEVLWADGNPKSVSESRLYFADAAGNVSALPAVMNQETARPELIWHAPPPNTQPADEANPQPQRLFR